VTNFTIGRRTAYEQTKGDLSAGLLEVFDRLVACASPTGNVQEISYRDEDLTGPVFATWREATILYLLAKHSRAKRALEIGCSVGWTSAHIAHGLAKGGTLTCIDPFTETAKGLDFYCHDAKLAFDRYMARGGLEDKVRLVVEQSPRILPAFEAEDGWEPWDFVFLDGWHLDGQPLRDIQGVLPQVKDTGVIALHDMWIDGVQEAARYLASQGWYFTGFFTSNSIGVFRKGDVTNEPKWWAKFMTSVDAIFEVK
jgi:predicted O-methyltransferase YrrM